MPGNSQKPQGTGISECGNRGERRRSNTNIPCQGEIGKDSEFGQAIATRLETQGQGVNGGMSAVVKRKEYNETRNSSNLTLNVRAGERREMKEH